MARLWDFLQRWGGPLVILAVFFVLAWTLWTYSEPVKGSTGQATSLWVNGLLFWAGFVGLIALVAWFLYCFTGVVNDWKIGQIILFCYFFTLLSLLGSVVPFVLFPRVPGVYQLMLESPVGIVLGCAKPLKEDPKSGPKELKCQNDTDQWLINIGGAIDSGFDLQKGKGAKAGEASLDRPSRVALSGGLIVPLYFVVLSLMGAAVSMTRRVPEYQGRVVQGAQRQMTGDQAREYLVFQIMQVISAPLIAITAYHLIEPGTRATSVTLGFVSGFASETVLLVIRALVEKVEPKTKPQV